MSIRIYHARYLLAALPLLMAACDGTSPNGGGGQTAELRVLHATSTLGPVDVLVDGSPVVSGLTFGATSPAVMIPAGLRQFEVRSGVQVLGTLQHSATTTHVNSMVIGGGIPQFSTLVVPDTGQPMPAKANLRLVNVVGSNLSPPTILQVLIKAPNANPDSVITSNLDATIGAYWSLMYFDPGAFDVRYVAAGDTVTLAHVNFAIAAGEKKAVVLSRAADGSYSADVMVEP